MGRLLSIAFGMTFALLCAAALLMRATPPAPAVAAPAAQHRSPWAPGPANPAPELASLSPAVALRDASGRFNVSGAINGRSLDLLVDTGADIVAVPAQDAPDYGIPVDPAGFRPMLRTASGTASGAPVRIASLTVGQRELREVDAVVVEGLDRVLLGQSALRRLGKVTIDGDRMEIGGQ